MNCLAGGDRAAPAQTERKCPGAGIASLAWFALILAGPAGAQEEAPAPDPVGFMNLPAVMTPDASKGLLLDVTRAGDRLVAVGERGFIVYSDDRGASWSQSTSPVSLTLTAVTFPTPELGWAVGHEGVILHSADSGVSWEVQFTGYDAARQEHVLATGNVESAEAALEQALAEGVESAEDLEWALEDAQIALDAVQMALDEGPSNPFLDVWFADARTGIAVGAYGMIFRTEDGGASWELWSAHIDNPDKFHYYAMSGDPASMLYLVGEQGLLYRSADGGREWERLDSPYEGSFFGTVAGNMGGQEFVLIYGLRGNLYRSTDRGTSWSRVDSGTEQALFGGTVLTDGSMVLVGNSGVVLRSNDGGASFSLYTRPDRRPYVSVLGNGSDDLVLVGRGGARVVGPDGQG